MEIQCYTKREDAVSLKGENYEKSFVGMFMHYVRISSVC